MVVIVVGGGKVGYYLAKTLLSHNHNPRLIEIKKDVCRQLANELDIEIINGDGTLIETLRAAGADKAEVLISVAGKDEDNLICCQLAKRCFGVKKTIAKSNNPKNADIMRRLGIDMPISSTDNIVSILDREIDVSKIKELISLNGGNATISELNIPDNFKFHNKKIMDLKLPNECNIVSIIRNGDLIIPRGNTTICAYDKVMVICQNNKLFEFANALGIN